jgi:hypothetical protein
LRNVEKIKFGDMVFDLIAAGVDLAEFGDDIVFKMELI